MISLCVMIRHYICMKWLSGDNDVISMMSPRRNHDDVTTMTSQRWRHNDDVTTMTSQRWRHNDDVTTMTSQRWRHRDDVTTMMTSPRWRNHYDVTAMTSPQLFTCFCKHIGIACGWGVIETNLHSFFGLQGPPFLEHRGYTGRVLWLGYIHGSVVQSYLLAYPHNFWILLTAS